MTHIKINRLVTSSFIFIHHFEMTPVCSMSALKIIEFLIVYMNKKYEFHLQSNIAMSIKMEIISDRRN